MKKLRGYISDLHIDASEDNDNSIVRDAFLNDIEERLNSGISFDFIVVTGDVANKGKSKDYLIANDFFKRLLEKVKLDEKKNIYCSGNHDLDRDKISKKKWWSIFK